jgi:hypothetical protein
VWRNLERYKFTIFDIDVMHLMIMLMILMDSDDRYVCFAYDKFQSSVKLKNWKGWNELYVRF